jgi:putative FmdB family regulatory protein
MPIYAYICHECELEEEQIHPVGQAPETLYCPLCGGSFVRSMSLFQVKALSPLATAPDPAAGERRHTPGCVCCRR